MVKNCSGFRRNVKENPAKEKLDECRMVKSSGRPSCKNVNIWIFLPIEELHRSTERSVAAKFVPVGNIAHKMCEASIFLIFYLSILNFILMSIAKRSCCCCCRYCNKSSFSSCLSLLFIPFSTFIVYYISILKHL